MSVTEGVLLDVAAERGEATAWVKRDDGRVVPLRAPYRPAFYVAGARSGLDALAEALPLVPGVAGVGLELRLLGLRPGRRRVLKVVTTSDAALSTVARLVDARGEHRDFDLYDVDLRASQRILLERGVFPFARVRGEDAASLTTTEDAWTLDYAPPPLSSLALSCRLRGDPPVPRPEDRVASVRVGEETLEGDEADVLREAAARVRRLDPDVVYTRGGDRWMLAHLEGRARALGLAGWTLGREAGGRAARRGRSFFSYGKIKYRAPTHPLPGRIHVDLDESFFFTQTSLPGVVDLARIAGIPLAELARLEAGTAVTAIQVGQAKRQGRLVPWRKNLPERPKTLRQLVKADRGGHIFDPVVGLHEDVVELDFASLYPALIARHNLGSETLLCACCDPATLPPERFVPQAGYHVCQRRRGLVPEVLERLVERRAAFKRMRKTDPARRAEYQGRVDAIKWLNVVSFGYQGYRNARFGCIEAHEATTAWAREAILQAMEVARDDGYEVLHGIIDSLWLRRVTRGACDAAALAAHVEAAVGIPFEPQGRYKWIVFLPNRTHDAPGAPPVGATNRFYGCFDKVPDAPSRSQAGQEVDYLAGGALKVRGVELRQSSAPRVVVETQERALNALAPAEDAAGFRARIPVALAAARPVLRRLRDHACRAEEVVIANRVTRGLDGRRQMTHAHAALRQWARLGVDVPAGDTLRYVVTDARSRDPETRVRLANQAVDGAYDAVAYEALVVRAL
ncbi:MAG TPA: DNA polymerase domain-containing protein, partial [Candidatus Thermoplasmatota archaeon]|nr:DNA polymerase domain-containing protein [Candidatus Thermoplasmatota archaeon]